MTILQNIYYIPPPLYTHKNSLFGSIQTDHKCSKLSHIQWRSTLSQSCCRHYWHWRCRFRCLAADRWLAPCWQNWHSLSGRNRLSQTLLPEFSVNINLHFNMSVYSINFTKLIYIVPQFDFKISLYLILIWRISIIFVSLHIYNGLIFLITKLLSCHTKVKELHVFNCQMLHWLASFWTLQVRVPICRKPSPFMITVLQSDLSRSHRKSGMSSMTGGRVKATEQSSPK